jgi:hypothetical protein
MKVLMVKFVINYMLNIQTQHKFKVVLYFNPHNIPKLYQYTKIKKIM